MEEMERYGSKGDECVVYRQIRGELSVNGDTSGGCCHAGRREELTVCYGLEWKVALSRAAG